jgi:hypothetical protein
MPRPAPRHDRDAAGPAEVLAEKAALRQEVWSAMRAARIPPLLEYALATAAGLIGPHTVSVTTVHELQVRPAGSIPVTDHDVPVDFIVTPERVIDCRSRHGPRAVAGICWDDLTEEKITAIPLLAAQRPGQR